jgi:thiamine biosynthesis lipoprotein ApbE
MMAYPLKYISIFKNNSHEMFTIVRSRPRLAVLEAAQHVGRKHPTGGVFDPKCRDFTNAWAFNGIYHLVMTNSLPWKITIFKFGKPSISIRAMA